MNNENSNYMFFSIVLFCVIYSYNLKDEKYNKENIVLKNKIRISENVIKELEKSIYQDSIKLKKIDSVNYLLIEKLDLIKKNDKIKKHNYINSNISDRISLFTELSNKED